MNQDIVITLEIPAKNPFMGVIGACVEELLVRVGIVDQQERYNVQLALHEIAVNIVNHAYKDATDGRIRLTLDYAPADYLLRLELLDTGEAFDPSVVMPPDLDALPESGLGLMLAQSLMDHVEYTRIGTTNRWRLIKAFN